MYSRPFASQSRLPAPRSMKGGVPPTARNARTGELTTPGMIFCERSNRRSFFEVMDAEQTREFPRAALDVMRVEQRADDGDGIRSRLDHGAGVFAGNSSSRTHVTIQARLCLPVERNRRSGCPRLRGRRKRAPEGDIVCAGVARVHREIEPIVAGRSQQAAPAQAL